MHSVKKKRHRAHLSQIQMMVIAVDGPAASGKGTLCKRIAQKLHFSYLDTGSLYRATALRVMRQGPVQPDKYGIIPGAAAAAMAITPEDMQDENIRSELVGHNASIVSSDPTVRKALLDFQRLFSQSPPDGVRGVVMDGRDIGTVVCPSASVKLYVTADPSIRAMRRHKELVASDKDVNLDQVKNDMQLRDHRDSTRALAPLSAAADAFTIDTSDLNSEQTVAVAMEHIRHKIPDVF